MSSVTARTGTPALFRVCTLVDPSSMGEDALGALMQLGNEVDGQPFVPGIYRMLAQWPGYLTHVSAVLRPF